MIDIKIFQKKIIFLAVVSSTLLTQSKVYHFFVMSKTMRKFFIVKGFDDKDGNKKIITRNNGIINLGICDNYLHLFETPPS